MGKSKGEPRKQSVAESVQQTLREWFPARTVVELDRHAWNYWVISKVCRSRPGVSTPSVGVAISCLKDGIDTLPHDHPLRSNMQTLLKGIINEG